jgi:hypothetical protein
MLGAWGTVATEMLEPVARASRVKTVVHYCAYGPHRREPFVAEPIARGNALRMLKAIAVPKARRASAPNSCVASRT